MKTALTAAMATLLACLAIPTTVEAQVRKWTYETSTDKMSGKKTKTGILPSKNSLNFDFPYAGSNLGFLMVREHPKHGLDVLFIIEKGQILCGIDGCEVDVKFDQDEPTSFEAHPPDDHSSDSIFILDAEKFVDRAKKAKSILVQFSAYQNGSPVLEFVPPAPLKWASK